MVRSLASYYSPGFSATLTFNRPTDRLFHRSKEQKIVGSNWRITLLYFGLRQPFINCRFFLYFKIEHYFRVKYFIK